MEERVTGLIGHRGIGSRGFTDSDSEVGRSAADFRAVRSEKAIHGLDVTFWNDFTPRRD